jgi:dTDP-4-amino-4,6-dideoxygalactose transaminase
MIVPPVKINFREEDRKDILKKIDEVLTSGILTLGKFGESFEKEFARYVGVKHAVACNSGTSAIEIPLRIFDVRGKEVIVPTNTFFATPAAVLHAGGKVRFADADPETFSIDVDDLSKKIGRDTKGIIVVHIGGIITPRIEEIRELCEDHGLFLLEDAAHAHGSSLNGKKAGCFGDVASFSFYPTKVITSGEGGMIVTDDDELQKKATIFRDQGKSGKERNLHVELGYNWRMSELHAILGISQLSRIEEFIMEREKIAKIYDSGLDGMEGIRRLVLPEKLRCNYYKYIALLDDGMDRDRIKMKLREKYKITLSGEVYEIPCHLQPVFQSYREKLPKAEDICKRHICLPIFPGQKEEEAVYILNSLRELL